MSKAFSVASWNCEHMKEDDPRNVERIKFLAEQKPDVLAIYEVEGANVWRELMNGMPGYSFFITEGQNTQEILLGIAPGITGFLTQKIEFQDRDSYMRPGAFLTVRAAGADYSMLFLHVASQDDARGFGVRTDMIDRAFAFKGYLDKKVVKGPTNFLFMGDLNSMGMDYVYGRATKSGNQLLHDNVSAQHEIERLGFNAGSVGMRVLSKNADFTWGSGQMRSNLDHVVAASHLQFRSFGGKEVDVRGWPKLANEKDQAKWMGKYSDHALLYFEVQPV